MCYGMLRAAACVYESDHHALYVWHGKNVRARAGAPGPVMSTNVDQEERSFVL